LINRKNSSGARRPLLSYATNLHWWRGFAGAQEKIRVLADVPPDLIKALQGALSNLKMRFQSFFMLITIQPSFFASSYSSWVKVPTFVSGSP
jgi:hypothetical protein